MGTPLLWIGFHVFVLTMLILDLGFLNRKAHVVSVKEAIYWTIFVIFCAFAFNAVIWKLKGSELGLQWFTGYIIEQSLSVDNLFIFILIFSTFNIPSQHQHRVLFWGILGAVIMRGAFIIVGTALVERFHWILYVFGAFLIYTGIKILIVKEENKTPNLDKNPFVRLSKKFFPVTSEFHGSHFFVKLHGVRHATPLFLVLILIETSDLIFAVDSIPAIFSITRDPFIVYTSNIFAILGLRSLYFCLASGMTKFRYLKPALAIILSFVGIKMLISYYYHIPTFLSLGIILGTLLLAAIASSLRRPF